jgi:hypothetical protein
MTATAPASSAMRASFGRHDVHDHAALEHVGKPSLDQISPSFHNCSFAWNRMLPPMAGPSSGGPTICRHVAVEDDGPVEGVRPLGAGGAETLGLLWIREEARSAPGRMASGSPVGTVQPGAADHMLKRRQVGGDHRGSCSHRLGDHDPEALATGVGRQMDRSPTTATSVSRTRETRPT